MLYDQYGAFCCCARYNWCNITSRNEITWYGWFWWIIWSIWRIRNYGKMWRLLQNKERFHLSSVLFIRRFPEIIEFPNLSISRIRQFSEFIDFSNSMIFRGHRLSEFIGFPIFQLPGLFLRANQLASLGHWMKPFQANWGEFYFQFIGLQLSLFWVQLNLLSKKELQIHHRN